MRGQWCFMEPGSEEEVLEAAMARARGVLSGSAARCDHEGAASRSVFPEASWAV